MEHPSHKSHVADVTTAGADVIVHKERLLAQKKAKYLFLVFILPTLSYMSSRISS